MFKRRKNKIAEVSSNSLVVGMLISIEGCIGVGKTTLACNLARRLSYDCVLEEYANNPFLSDFYNRPTEYALQVQTTFLFLQERTMRNACFSDTEKNTIFDFYPQKSLIFGRMILSKDDLSIVETMFSRLFNNYPLPNLFIYLTADINVLFQRIRFRDDIFTRSISQKYIRNLVKGYDIFFESYTGKKLHLNTNHLDLRDANSSDMDLVVSEVKKIL